MFQKFNFQYIFSYAGLIPYLYILLDKYYFFQINEDIILNFLIHYTLLISVFIGSTNWSFDKKLNNYIVIYGFLPSLFATLIIIINLTNFNQIFIITLIIIIIISQLILDYFFIYRFRTDKTYFFFLRLPLTVSIILILSKIII